MLATSKPVQSTPPRPWELDGEAGYKTEQARRILNRDGIFPVDPSGTMFQMRLH